MDDIASFITQLVLFFIIFKLGQASGMIRANQELRNQHQRNIVEKITQKPVITVEEINGIYYAFDGNDFLAQGRSPDELGSLIATRFPQKYRAARVEIKP